MLKVLENTMRSIKKAKGKSLGNLQAKRPHYKVESQKSNVESLGKHHAKRSTKEAKGKRQKSWKPPSEATTL
jgi:hypothetical protein